MIILLDTKGRIEEYSVTVADKMWQTSQSNHSKGLNLEKDLDNLISRWKIMDGTKIQKEFGADLGKKAMVVRRDRRQRKEEGGFPSSKSNAKSLVRIESRAEWARSRAKNDSKNMGPFQPSSRVQANDRMMKEVLGDKV